MPSNLTTTVRMPTQEHFQPLDKVAHSTPIRGFFHVQLRSKQAKDSHETRTQSLTAV